MQGRLGSIRIVRALVDLAPRRALRASIVIAVVFGVGLLAAAERAAAQGFRELGPAQPTYPRQPAPSQQPYPAHPEHRPAAPANNGEPQFRAPGGEFSPRGNPQQSQQPQHFQPPANGQPGNPPANAPQPIGPPEWFPLPPDQEKRVDDLLTFWQNRSQQVRTYRCKFTRWEYDPNFVPRGFTQPLRVSQGEIKYAAPDKGLFQVTSLQELQTPIQPGQQPVWLNQPEQKFEHWVCDGNSIFEFRHIERQLVETQLPPNMRGQAIADGPLPFLFGANAQSLKDRYWIRELKPDPPKDEWWLEATPKNAADRANFLKAIIILDATDHMPSGLVMFLPNGDSRTTYDFKDRKVNDWQARLNEFLRVFIAPALPAGYKKVVVPWQGAPPQPGDPANPPPAENAAERPRGFLPGTR